MSHSPPPLAPFHIWNGPFATWEQACDSAATGDAGFVNDRWTSRITDQLQSYRKARAEHGLALPPRPCNLPWVCAAMGAREIVDFGGSSGWSYDYLAHTLVDHPIKSYVIIEIDGIVSHMRRTGLQSSPVRYQTAAETITRCDLLYCNSVLQYFRSNAELLQLVKLTRPDHVLLDDLLAKGDQDFFSTQNYYEYAIPHRFLGLRQLQADMAGIGYQLMLSAPFTSPIMGVMKPLPMENFPAEFQLRYALSVLFKKKAA